MFNQGKLTYHDALIQILTSQHVGRLCKDHKLTALEMFLRQHPSCPLDLLPDDFYDLVPTEVCNDEKNVSYKILSDDADNPNDAGPWTSTVWGFAGVWIVWSPEYDHSYYSSRDSAISYCEDLACESIIQVDDYPIQPWQVD